MSVRERGRGERERGGGGRGVRMLINDEEQISLTFQKTETYSKITQGMSHAY